MSKDIIIIDGVRYHSDRPSSCRGCYFWKLLLEKPEGRLHARQGKLLLPGRVPEKEKSL